MEDPAWEQELERRIRIYEQMEATGQFPGRLTSTDYLALAGLAALFIAVPWIWVY